MTEAHATVLLNVSNPGDVQVRVTAGAGQPIAVRFGPDGALAGLFLSNAAADELVDLLIDARARVVTPDGYPF